MQSYFIWNSMDCRSMGIVLTGPAPIVQPEERVKHIEIPGRSGDLTQTEGEQIYNSYIQTVTIQVKGGLRVREISRWLRGSGYVTFSGEPDRKQKARIIGAVTLNKLPHNFDIWAGEVQFYCQPLKELLWPADVEVTSSGTVVRNFGDVIAKPMWKVMATASTAVVSCGDRSLTIGGLSSSSTVWIDSEVMEVLNVDKTDTLTKDATGGFPQMYPGDNEITGSGWSKLVIDKRERYL